MLCVALGRHSLAGLTAAVSLGYSVAAVAALAVLARHRVNIISGVWSVHVRRSLVASLVATLAMAVVYAVPTWTRGRGLLARFGGAFLVGVVAYLVVVALCAAAFTGLLPGARLERF